MDYWSQYYIDRARERLEPSSFARWCAAEGWVAPADRVVDAGCGDGRDAIFFAGLGARVVAVDAAESAVQRCVALGLCAACASMGSLPKPDELLPPGTWHEAAAGEAAAGEAAAGEAAAGEAAAGEAAAGRLVVYSRFSLHAIDAKEAEAFLAWCRLHADVLLIETRSVNDPRYGRGDDAGNGAFVDTHYRRFTRLSDLTTELRALGFVVEHASEDWKAARTAYDAAVVNRVIVRRP